LWEENFPIGK
jgi:hypothetical protein